MVAQPPRVAPDDGGEMPLRRFYQVVFRHKVKMLLFFAVVVAAVLGSTLLLKPAYRSEAKLLVQVGRESVTLDPTAAIGEKTLDPRTTWENELNSELEVARSDELIRAVVQQLGPDVILGRGAGGGGAGGAPKQRAWYLDAIADAKDRVRSLLPARGAELSAEDRAVLLVDGELDVRLVEDSSVIKIGFEAPDRELARRVVATFIEHYLDKHLEAHTTPGSFEYFSAETARLERELAAREDELLALKSSAGVSSVPEELTILHGRQAALEKEIDLNAAAIGSGEARVASMEEALSRDDLDERIVVQETTVLNSQTRDLLRQQLNVLLLEEQSLLQSWAPDTPPVRSVRERIALARRLLDSEEPEVTQSTRGMNPSRQSLLVALLTGQAELASLRAKQEGLRPQLASVRARLAEVTDLDLLIKRKTREITKLEESYRRHGAGLEQVRVGQALQLEKISNITVLQPATLPLRSLTLSRTNALLIGVFLGLVGALALAFTCEFLDQSLRSPEDVQRRLGLPALASVPRRRALRGLRRIALAPLREFSQIEDRIVDGATRSGAVFALTSARRGEGVSTVAANLANRLAAREEGTVLLVDASLYSPSVHRTFSMKIAPGLSEKLLSGSGNGARESAVSNLSVLTAGDTSKGARGGFGRESVLFDRLARELDELLAAWRAEFRYVVLDLPAVSEESQVPQVAARCDGVLLVVAAGQNRWQILQHAREQLETCAVNLLGVVLNKRRYPIPGWLYRTL